MVVCSLLGQCHSQTLLTFLSFQSYLVRLKMLTISFSVVGQFPPYLPSDY